MGIFRDKLRSFFRRSELKAEFWVDLEDLLLSSDVGLPVTRQMIDAVKDSRKVEEVKDGLHRVMSGILKSHKIIPGNKPHVIMVVGVNGTGKTTTIAKLAHRFKKEGRGVLLVAADTFRAAAIEQIKIWGDRLGIPVVAQKQDSDTAAVAFDGVRSGIAKNYDVVILDTAGRLHTNKNLMDELSKVRRVVGKALSGAPHDTILVLDATVGQNGLVQARKFHEALNLTGVILAKMDGTAKGGVIFSVAGELNLPISFIGVGEKLEDLEEFEKGKFINDILG